MTDTLAAVRGIENLKPAGRRALVDVANSLGINPDWLASVISFESAGSFDPAKKNAAGSGATGLIQFMPATAGLLGYTIPQLASMSQETQLRGPVFQYFKNHGKLGTLEDTYLAVFYPAAIGQSDDYVVGRQGSKVYEQNKGFDTANTGIITKRMITSTIRGVYNSALTKPRVEVPDSLPFSEPSSTSDSSEPVPMLLLTGEPDTVAEELSSVPQESETELLSNCWDKVKEFFKNDTR